jgi:hypothetical protein
MPVHGDRKPFAPDQRQPVQITRYAWNRLMERLADVEDRLNRLDGGPRDAA